MGFFSGVTKGLFGGGGGGDTRTTSTGKSSINLPDWYKDLIESNVQRAGEQAQTPYTPYTGDRAAGFTPDQLAAQQGIRQQQGRYGPLISQATGLAGAIGRAPTQEELAAYRDPYTDVLQRRAVERADVARQDLDRTAAQVSAFGGSRLGLQEAQLEDNLQQQLGDIEAQSYGQGLAALRQSQQAGLQGLLGTAQAGQGLDYRDLSALAKSGAVQQQLGQQQADFDYQQFREGQAYPQQQIGWLSNLLGQNTYAYPQTTSGTNINIGGGGSGNQFGQILGTAGTLYALGGGGGGGAGGGSGFFNFKDGGSIKKAYANGGSIEDTMQRTDFDLSSVPATAGPQLIQPVIPQATPMQQGGGSDLLGGLGGLSSLLGGFGGGGGAGGEEGDKKDDGMFGRIIGTAIGAYVGGPTGAAVGGNLGGQLGFADGGSIREDFVSVAMPVDKLPEDIKNTSPLLGALGGVKEAPGGMLGSMLGGIAPSLLGKGGGGLLGMALGGALLGGGNTSASGLGPLLGGVAGLGFANGGAIPGAEGRERMFAEQFGIDPVRVREEEEKKRILEELAKRGELSRTDLQSRVNPLEEALSTVQNQSSQPLSPVLNQDGLERAVKAMEVEKDPLNALVMEATRERVIPQPEQQQAETQAKQVGIKQEQIKQQVAAMTPEEQEKFLGFRVNNPQLLDFSLALMSQGNQDGLLTQLGKAGTTTRAATRQQEAAKAKLAQEKAQAEAKRAGDEAKRALEERKVAAAEALNKERIETERQKRDPESSYTTAAAIRGGRGEYLNKKEQQKLFKEAQKYAKDLVENDPDAYGLSTEELNARISKVADDYIQRATAATSTSTQMTPDDVRARFQAGEISKEEAMQLIRQLQ